jgi:hypothetical protein
MGHQLVNGIRGLSWNIFDGTVIPIGLAQISHHKKREKSLSQYPYQKQKNDYPGDKRGFLMF